MPDIKRSDPLYIRGLAEHVKRALTENGLPTVWFWRERFWHWTGGAYRCMAVKEMVPIVCGFLMKASLESSHYQVRETTYALAAMSFLHISKYPCWIDSSGQTVEGPYAIAMQDQIVDPEGLALDLDPTEARPLVYKPTPAWFSSTKFNYPWDPSATCSTGDMLCRENLTGPEAVRTYQAFCGTWLIPKTNEGQALFLIGPKGSGKSALADMARVLLDGETNVSNLAISQFGEKFSMPITEGKLLNIADEVGPVISSKAEEKLKWFLTGKPMTIEQKGIPAYDVTPTARLLVCLNQYPKFHDESGAIWRRITPLRVPKMIPNDKMDRQIYVNDGSGRLQAEGPGLFNFAIAGLADYLRGNRLPICQDSQDELLTASSENCNVRTFLAETLSVDLDGYLSSKDLQDLYGNWCDHNGVSRADRTNAVALGRAVRREYPGAMSKRKRFGGITRNGYSGVKIT